MNVKKTKSLKKTVLKITMSMTSGTPSPTSSSGLVTWTNSFLRGGQRNINEYMSPRGELISRPPQNPRYLPGGAPYPTPGEV